MNKPTMLDANGNPMTLFVGKDNCYSVVMEAK